MHTKHCVMRKADCFIRHVCFCLFISPGHLCVSHTQMVRHMMGSRMCIDYEETQLTSRSTCRCASTWRNKLKTKA
jgi:hypothetical protein